jgi:cytochrome c553
VIAAMMNIAASRSLALFRKAMGMLSMLYLQQPLLVLADGIDTGGQAPYEQCGYCHEYDGNTPMGNYPKLAGQKVQYLVKQLRDYRSGRRNGQGLMEGTSALLSEQDIQTVAEHFSAQQRTLERATDTTANLSLARAIYSEGIADRQIVACKLCHQSADTRVPTLSGQHAQYLAMQLHAFKNKTRSNDPASFMQFTAERLSDEEITALSQFIATGGDRP